MSLSFRLLALPLFLLLVASRRRMRLQREHFDTRYRLYLYACCRPHLYTRCRLYLHARCRPVATSTPVADPTSTPVADLTSTPVADPTSTPETVTPTTQDWNVIGASDAPLTMLEFSDFQ